MPFNRRRFLRSATVLMAANFDDNVLAEEMHRSTAPDLRLWRVQAARMQQAVPLCCVLIPFGLRLDPAGRMIDFAHVYDNMITPAVRNAGFQVARAHEPETGERVTRQIIDRLLQSDHVIVDVSDRNSDISYELGIRARSASKRNHRYLRGRRRSPLLRRRDANDLVQNRQERPARHA